MRTAAVTGADSSVATTSADLNTPDAAGNTPLHLTALRNDAEAVEALLANGADAAAVNHTRAVVETQTTTSLRP